MYVDIILIENILMNYLIILTTCIICKTKVRKIRILIASTIGGLYAVVMYLFKMNLYNNQIIKILLSVCMIYVSFNSKNIKILLKQLLVFYLTSFCFGGAAYYLLYCVNPNLISYMNGMLVGTYPIIIAILGGTLGFFVIVFSFQIIKNRFDKKNIIYIIEIWYKNKKDTVKVMLDTGNLLKEPITNIPVLVVEIEKLKNIISNDIRSNIEKKIYNNITENIEEEFKSRFCIIPFSSIGKDNGIIIGFRPDYIKIYTDDREKIRKKIVIGMYNKRIARDETYSGLMGLNILDDELRMGDENEYNSNIKI